MDFASLMSAQIQKAKQSSSTSSNSSSQSKYVKRADVEAQRQAAYAAEQQAIEAQRVERLLKKRKFEEEEAQRNQARDEKRKRLAEESKRRQQEEDEAEERARRKRLGLPDPPPKDASAARAEVNGTADEDLDDTVIVQRLRDAGEPVLLFGESEAERRKRHRRLFAPATGPLMTKGPIPTTLLPVPEEDMKLPDKVPKSDQGRQLVLRQLASYFSLVLTEWQAALAQRDEDVKNSTTGKAAHSAMMQARDGMVPLFRKLERNQLGDDILKPVVEIVRCCQERRYVHANDAYLRLSIGKAAWPIGVTMVGIHERSAREKLHESGNAAHIMSDETTRKYLQSIKRCLSFAQTRWPPHDQLQLMG